MMKDEPARDRKRLLTVPVASHIRPLIGSTDFDSGIDNYQTTW